MEARAMKLCRLLLHGEEARYRSEVIQQFLVMGSDKLLPKVSAVVVIMLVSTLINRLD